MRAALLRLGDRLLRSLADLLTRLFHDLKVEGAENVPAEGAVILAANHPTYLDPVYIMCRLERPVRFLAWERPFRIPVLGWLMRQYGAIPVDTEKPGRASFEAAVKALRRGEAFGIFPEGGRSRYGPMNPLKSGVARLALMTGAPIVPITIRGAFRVWPRHRLLPRPGKVSVEFHEPLRIPPEERAARRRDKDFEREIVDRVLRAVHQRLLPSLKAERKEAELVRRASIPLSPWVEGMPFLFLGVVLSARWEPPWAALGVAAGYALYLLADARRLARGAWAVVLRNFSPWVVALLLARTCGLWPRTPAGSAAAWAAAAAGLPALFWFQFFRHRPYRLFRPWGLAAVYALYAWRLLR